jgi:hypothetical protein
MSPMLSDNELMLACLARHRGALVQHEIIMNEIKAAFVLRGTTLRRWARSHHIDPSHVQKAVTGKRRGPVARKILEQVLNSVRGGQS